MLDCIPRINFGRIGDNYINHNHNYKEDNDDKTLCQSFICIDWVNKTLEFFQVCQDKIAHGEPGNPGARAA